MRELNKEKIRTNKTSLKNLLIAIAILIIVFIILFVILKYKAVNGKDKTLIVNNMELYNNENDKNSKIKNNFYNVQNISENTKNYEINIFYPMTKSEKLNKYILTKINAYIKDIKYVAKGSERLNDAHKYTLEMSFNEYNGNDNTISFAFYVTYDINYLHINRSIFTVIYHTKNDKVIKIEDLMKKYENFVVDLSEYSYNELVKDERITSLGVYDILASGTAPNKYNFSNIVIDKDSIIVMFEMYQVAPYVAGEFEVKVPISYLEGEK